MSDLGGVVRSYLARRKRAEGGEVDADDMIDAARDRLASQPARRVLPDVGEPLVGSGGEFSPGARWANKAADIGGKLVSGMAHGVATLPRRAIENSQYSLNTGDYDPRVPVEAAMMTMGTGVVAGVPVKGAEAVLGAGPIRKKGGIDVAEPAAAETRLDVGSGLAGPSGGAEGVRAAELQAERRAGERQSLEGLPRGAQIVEGEPFIPGPVARVHDVADRYMADKDFGVPHPDKFHPIDVDHAKAIAQAFEDMPHAPNDPKVKAAYEALAQETKAQYEAIVEHGGLKVTPAGVTDYPYHGNPRAVAKDVADNNHMAFFKSNEGFGSTPIDLVDQPMMRSSGIKVGDHDMLYNDLFRVVHDYFGHVKNGNGFRGAGEDNAWRAHAAMYSPEARRAMTTETRGQNSWLNYGPHGDFNRTANGADTIYAQQKVGLLPDWVMQDRPRVSTSPTVAPATSTSSPSPIVAYHGSPHDFDRFDLSKVGTGEGAQAYGHGLYFAENEKVARAYRDQLAGGKQNAALAGATPSQQEALRTFGDNFHASDLGSFSDVTPDILDHWARGFLDSGGSPDVAKALATLPVDRVAPNKGRMYEVGINADHGRLLNWDRPLREQPEGARKILSQVGGSSRSTRSAGEVFENGISARGPRWMSDAMNDVGVPGIKYLDQGSRIAGDAARIMKNYGSREKALEVAQQRLKAAGTGDLRYWDGIVNQLSRPETNNFVIFNDKLIDIRKKYADGGAATPRAFADGGNTDDIDWSKLNTLGGELRASPPPKPTERISNAVADLLMVGGMKPYTANDLTSRVGDVIGASPLGIAGSAMNAIDAKARGNNAGVAEAMVGMLPGVKRARGVHLPPRFFEGPLGTNAGVDAPVNKAVQTVADPHRMMFPGIYRNPKEIAEEAASRVGPEDPAMKELFGVTRGDLREMAQGRVGNEEPNLKLAANPRGSLAAQNIQTPKNTQRLVDILDETGKHEGLRTADAWYIMDPVYKRMEQMFGPEEAARRYKHLNTTTAMASPGSDVLTEIQRGTGAHWLQDAGRFGDFRKYVGLPNDVRHASRMPADIKYIQGHPYHRTSQADPMQKYFDAGSIQSENAKVPLYAHASGVPETGFQTTGPVGDAHFSRGVGLADTRKGPTDVGSSFSRAEYQTLQPWWQHDVAGKVGLESVPAQARLWTGLGPQTGVESELGAPKLELFAKQIAKAARRLGVSPEKARDLILSGKAGAGALAGAVLAPRAFQSEDEPMAKGGRVGYEEGGDVDMPVFNPAKLAAVRPRAPTFDPARLAGTKPPGDGSMSAGDVLSGAIENAPASAGQFLQDVVRPVTHPLETLGGIKDLGLGLLEKSGAVGTFLPPAGEETDPATGKTRGAHEKYADAMGQYLKARYGGWENVKQSIAKDPVGVLSDASMIATGGGSAAARLPGVVGKAGEVMGNVGRAVDPLLAPVNAARAGTKVVGELLTHTGAGPLENAYKAGVEGGEAGETLRGHMRGTSDMVEPVQMAKAGLEGYRAARSKNYREGMGDITSIDRQMDPLDRVLDFGKIDDAVDSARKVQTFKGQVLDKGAEAVRNEMIAEIDHWKSLPPGDYHTIEGLDALKRSLGHMMMDTAPGSSSRKASGEIYNAVRKTIVEYDPKYAQVMKDYEQASAQVRELERAMSLGEKASADTALRKLQSIMRNNVNANYGRRLELGKLLEENGATHLMAALSGQSLSAWAPRGLGKLGAEAVALGAAGHFLSPVTLAAAPLMSPRIMGEVAHGAGRTVGRVLSGSNRLMSGVGGNRTIGNTSYRLGRSTNPNENNPYAP